MKTMMINILKNSKTVLMGAVLGLLLSGCPVEEPRLECGESVTCAQLVTLTCGEDDTCADSQSCEAALRLQTRGEDGTCHTAFCDLGHAYRQCL